MPKHALDKWLLVNYAGYPFAPNSLMPDNGLANLAGALQAQGKDVEILDYCTVSTLRRMTSPELRGELSQAWKTLRARGRGPIRAMKRLGALRVLHRCEKERRRLQDVALKEITEEVVARVRQRGATAVGFKLWNGDGLEGAGQLAQAVRRRYPEVRVFGGGPHVDIFSADILAHYPCFDALVCGEGEETIQYLAATGNDPASYGSIPNLILFRDGAPVPTEERMIDNLDDLPMPVYDPAVYPAMAGDEKVKIAVLDESRGCRNECAFCVHPVKSHRRVRVKSIPRLLAEIGLLGERYGFHAFRFAGSCTPYTLLNEFAAEVIRQKRHVRYASFAHIRDSHEADFGRIAESGCVSLFFGIESGSQRILDAMRKRIQVDQIADTLRRADAAGIFTVGSIIVPAPGEGPDSQAETLSLLKGVPLKSLMLQAPVVAPRTDWFESPERYGIEFRDKARYLREALKWKIKFQLPPRFWDPLPIRIGGRSYRQVLSATMAFGRKLDALGMPMGITDETYLMSVLAGMPAVSFRDAALGAFFAGDGDAVAPLVARINAGVAPVRPPLSATTP
jgi:hypothetical protein